mgnify:CR=1 FL=1
MNIQTKPLKKIINNVMSSESFKEELGSSHDYYPAHIFLQLDKNYEATNNCQVGFYSKEKDNLCMFEIIKEESNFLAYEEAFKEGGVIEELQIENEDVSFQTAKDKFLELCKEKYPAEIINNYIVIAQNIKGNNVLNCTAISLSFAMISIHIDIESLEIIFEQKNSILDLKKDMPK